MADIDRFELFLTYLESPDSLSERERLEFDYYLSEYNPFSSPYLRADTMFQPPWSAIISERLPMRKVANTLFYNGELRATVRPIYDHINESPQLKTLKIEKPEYLLIDLLYSKILNYKTTERILLSHELDHEQSQLLTFYYTLNTIGFSKFLSQKEAANLNKAIKRPSEAIKDKIDDLPKRYKIAFEQNNKSIIYHLFIVFRNYAPEIKNQPCCQRIAELLNILYSPDFFTWPAIKKTLQRQNLI